MMLKHYSKRVKPVFDLELWLKSHQPKKRRTGRFWDDVHLEYDEVIESFKTFMSAEEPVVDINGDQMTPYDIFNAVEDYKIRVDKLMLIFNIRLYKTFNVHKKTGVRYIVMRAFWIDHYGKNVRWFSKNIGAENKVAPSGVIPKHMLDSVEEDILHLMWDQYIIDYDYSAGYTYGTDQDGNNIIIEED